MNNPFIPLPVLTSERLVLRQLTEQDARAMFVLRIDYRVNQFLDRPKPAHIEDVKAFIRKVRESKWVYWAICFKETSDLIGTICLWNFSDDQVSAEVGYELNPDFQGKGIMDEALKAVTAFCFEKTATQWLQAYTHQDNQRSRQLLERNHFSLNEGDEGRENPDLVAYQLKKKD